MAETVFDVDETFSLDGLARRVERAGIRSARESRHRVVSTYYDTPELRLLTAGVTVAQHRSDRTTWVLSARTSDGPFEVLLSDDVGPRAAALAHERVPGQLASQLIGWVGDGDLGPRFTVDTERLSAEFDDADGSPLATVADDRMVVETLGDGRVTTWRRVTLEASPIGAAAVDLLARHLRKSGGRPAASGPLPTAAVTDDTGGRQAGQLGAVITKAVATLAAADLAIRRDEPEGVHDLRVSTRRLRSVLKSYRHLFDKAAIRPLLDELTWLGSLLGAARDAEVLEQRVTVHLDALPPESVLGPIRGDLLGDLRSERLRTLEDVRAALDSERYRRLVGALHRTAADLPLRQGNAPRARDHRRAVMREVERARRVEHQAQSATPAQRDAAIHEVRKASKRVRYACEAAAGELRHTGRLRTAAEKVQSLLGDRNDAVVAQRLLAAEGARTGVRPGRNGYTYGLLAGGEAERIAAADRAFVSVWRDFDRAARRVERHH